MTHDKAEFAVETGGGTWRVREETGSQAPFDLRQCGRKQSSRSRAWKLHRQELAFDLALSITVGHYPLGTSKWNKIEHRLFSFLSLTWKGQPLLYYETS
jgi:hypothetical protein